MTWELTSTIARHKLSIVAALNLLQGNHVISDLVVNPEDIWEGDCPAAVKWLEENHTPPRVDYKPCHRSEKWVDIKPGELIFPESWGNQVYKISEEKQLQEKCPRPDKHLMPGRGQVGQYIAAKGLNLLYLVEEGVYSKPDLTNLIEVKAAGKDYYGLKIPLNQAGETKMVGVIIPDWNFELPKYRLTGWIYARDGKKPEWLNDWGDRQDPVYNVPQEFLRPIFELEAIIAEERDPLT